jgi:hypothetical protein
MVPHRHHLPRNLLEYLGLGNDEQKEKKNIPRLTTPRTHGKEYKGETGCRTHDNVGSSTHFQNLAISDCRLLPRLARGSLIRFWKARFPLYQFSQSVLMIQWPSQNQTMGQHLVIPGLDTVRNSLRMSGQQDKMLQRDIKMLIFGLPLSLSEN